MSTLTNLAGTVKGSILNINGHNVSGLACDVPSAPNFRDLFATKYVPFIIAWIVGGACALLALIICFDQLLAFSKAQKSARRSYYTGVVLMAPVFAITNYLALFFPRAALLLELMQHVYEANALFCFGHLIFDLATDGEADPLIARQILLQKLANVKPMKLDAAPPMCWIRCCVPAVQVTERRLERIMWGISVFQKVVPACAAVRLWVTLETKSPYVQFAAKIGLFAAENAAMAYTLHSLFQLYVATHDIIHRYNSTSKFVAIKAILGIAVLQSAIINGVVHKFIAENAFFSRDMQAEFWSDFALACEAIMLAMLHRGAYPREELFEGDVLILAKLEDAKRAALIRAALPLHQHKDTDEEPVQQLELIKADTQWTPEMDEEHWPGEKPKTRKSSVHNGKMEAPQMEPMRVNV